MRPMTSLLTAGLMVTLTAALAGCASPESISAQPTPQSTAAETPDLVAEAAALVEEWDGIDPSDYVLPGTATEHYSAEQVDSVAADAIQLLRLQLEHQQAEDKPDAQRSVDEFIEAAPGMLSDSMREVSDAGPDTGEDALFQLIFVQPVDARFTVGEGSRATHAWSVTETEMHGTDGLQVALFHRSAYEVATPDGGAGHLSVGRWITLSTIDPAYAHESGDYLWHLDYATRGADFCTAANNMLLAPADDAQERDDLLDLLEVAPGEFAQPADFQTTEKEVGEATETC